MVFLPLINKMALQRGNIASTALCSSKSDFLIRPSTSHVRDYYIVPMRLNYDYEVGDYYYYY